MRERSPIAKKIWLSIYPRNFRCEGQLTPTRTNRLWGREMGISKIARLGGG